MSNGNGNFDDDGNTSEFSACRKVNTLPTFTAQAQTPSDSKAVRRRTRRLPLSQTPIKRSTL
jgi:hypothetical protein